MVQLGFDLSQASSTVEGRPRYSLASAFVTYTLYLVMIRNVSLSVASRSSIKGWTAFFCMNPLEHSVLLLKADMFFERLFYVDSIRPGPVRAVHSRDGLWRSASLYALMPIQHHNCDNRDWKVADVSTKVNSCYLSLIEDLPTRTRSISLKSRPGLCSPSALYGRD
nr:hypothetical protein CFP56_34739 [Quercus suber]